MATIADSRGTYSWWWDGHITPKNSKWLQENLSDMDDKVLEMLKLIEEDGDSFARRAEMFYQRRPKLLELIEQFHRAYRALAERYDHASGVLRQVHNTMTEADLDTNEFDVGKFLSTRISDLQESVSRAGIDIETLKQDLGRVEAERDAAVEECSEVERLRVALSETAEEKEAFALQCREGSLNISELDQRLNSELEKCGLLEKSNRALQSELHDSVRKMGDQSEELIEEIKDLSRVWTVLQQQAHENSNRVIEEVEARNRDLEEKFSSASAISSKLKDENILLRDIAKDLEADIERQVKHQNDLHREIDRLKNQIGAVKSEANEEKASLASRLEIASDKNEKLEKKCRELENSLSSADSELEVSRNRVEATWLLLLFEQLVLIAERERSERRYQELETKCFGFNNENTKLRLDLDKERKQHKELYEALGLEIVTLKHLVRDLEDRNSSVEGNLEKIVETLRSSESRVRDMELEILERDTEMKSLSDQLKVMLTEARDFSRMAERGLESGIESSVLYTVLRQMDVEVKRIAAEREKHVSDLVKRILTANIRETLLEESKDREIEELMGRIESLEGQNVRLAPLLATYHTAAETSARVDNLEIKDIKHITNVQIGSPKPVKLEAPRNTVPDREDEHKETKPLLLRKEAKRHAFKQPMKLTRRRQLSQGESDVVVTKDVVLDQMSECSGTDDRILELWEAADDVSGSSINLKVGMRSRSHSKVASSHRNSRESMSVTEKELGVDGEVEMLSEKKVPEPSGRRSVRRVLERLNADVQKLTNLHITVQDLRRKVELTDQRAEEYDNVKEQLEETEVAIMNFFDTNQKLTKLMQKLVSTNEGGDSVRKVSEQARRVTEEIGRLQLELQRIQWLLVKLDEEDKKEKRRGSGGGARPTTTIGNSLAERKTKVVLKDILHVRMKKNMKRKKGQFCGCVHLPSSRSE